MPTTQLIAAASHFPERVVSNFDLEKIVDTNDAWITSRTGIKTRHFAKPGESTSDLAITAAKKLLERINKPADEIDAIILATVTPDMLAPSSACIVQHKLGASRAWAHDINAACSGFIYALTIADQFIKTGKIKNALVIGSEVMSITLDMTDRATCVLFGDGAGVVYVEATTATNSGIIDTALYSDGSGAELLCMPAGGSRIPASQASVDQRLHYLRQDGQAVFKVAVTQMANVADAMLNKHKLQGSDLKFFIPHQANLRIIDACSKRLNLRSDQVVINLDQRGNTTAATIPTCLADIEAAGKLQRGDLILLAAFGAGFTYGSALLRW